MEREFREGAVYTCSACGTQISERDDLMDYWLRRYEFRDAYNVIINDDNLVYHGWDEDSGYDVSCIHCLAKLGSRDAGNVDDPPNRTHLFLFDHGRVVPPPEPENLQPPANPVHQRMCKSKQSFRTTGESSGMAGSPNQTPSNMNCSVAAPIHKLSSELLERILSFLPFKQAIRTCVLSHKWKNLWRGSTSLCIIYSGIDKWAGRATDSVRGLTTAKLTNFHLMVDKVPKRPNDVYEWESAAKYLKTDNITIIRFFGEDHGLRFWKDFYINDSVKRLTLQLEHPDMLPRDYWPVSWPLLTSLSLCCQYLPQQVFCNIIIGCPLLENVTIYQCADQLGEFDFSKAPTLRSLDLHFRTPPKMVIIDAPSISCLRLQIDSPCKLVNVTNLEEERVYGYLGRWVTKDSHLDMIQKFQNVKKLTFGSDFLMMLTVAQLGDAPCPTFKVENLTFETEIKRSNLPEIRRLLQKSPALKKLTIDMVKLPEEKAHAHDYWSSQGLYFDQSWESNEGVYFLVGKDGEPELVHSVIKFLLRNAINLETLVVRVRGYVAESEFQKLSTMIPQKMGNNVTVVLKKSFVRSFTSIFGGMACSEHGTDASMMI